MPGSGLTCRDARGQGETLLACSVQSSAFAVADGFRDDDVKTHLFHGRGFGQWALGLALAAGVYAWAAPAPPESATSGDEEIRVALDSAFAPISAAPDGKAQGYAIDLMGIAAKRAALKPRFIAKATFADALTALQAHEVDVIVASARNDERLAYASFVGPYYSAQSVIVTRLDGGWNSIAALAGHTLAIDRSHYLIESLRRDAPSVRVVEYDTAPVAMRAVAQGDADAMVTNIEVAARLINAQYLGQLQVSGVVAGRPSELYFAVRNDRPELAARLSAGLAQVTDADRATLAGRWLRTIYEPGVPWTTIAAVGLPLGAALLGIIAIVSVYNRRLRAEIKRRDVAEQALASERDAALEQAAAKADFLSTMGHEIRTPLTAIAGGIDVLRTRALGDENLRLVERMHRASQYLVALLNDILDYAKLDAHRIAITLAPVDVGALVHQVAEEFEPLARIKGLELHYEGTPGPALMIDALRLRQVVANLIGNALKFTIEGRVTVVYAQETIDAQRARLTIRVIDTGIGIASTARPALFERFSRVHAVTRDIAGTGLGLAIVREIMQRQGGTVEVESQVGVGSTFTVSCEAELAGEAAPSAAEQAARDDTSLEGRHVLLVEDDALVRYVLSEQLNSMGCKVQTAASADEGLQALRNARFDAVVADLQLGAKDGTVLAQAVRHAAGEAGMAASRPVLVACSGDTSAATIRACLQAGFDAHLAKPATMSDLRAVLLRLLATPTHAGAPGR